MRIRRLFHGDEPRHPGVGRGGDAARGAGVLPPAGVGAPQVLLRRPQEGHPPVHELQRPHREGQQLARFPAPALLPARELHRPVAVKPAIIQASGWHLRDRSASAGAASAGGDLGEPGPGAEPHGGGDGEASAAHGGELLPAVPAAGAHLRAAGPQGPQCHHAAAPGRRLRAPGAARRRPLGRREPRARRARHQHRRPDAGAQQRPLQERAPPRHRQQRERADLRAHVLLPVAGRRDRAGGGAGGRGAPAGVPALHLPGVLRRVLEHGTPVGKLPRPVQTRLNARGIGGASTPATSRGNERAERCSVASISPIPCVICNNWTRIPLGYFGSTLKCQIKFWLAAIEEQGLVAVASSEIRIRC